MLASSLLTLTSITAGNFLGAAHLATDASQKAKPATIKVLITKQTEELLLEVRGRYQIYNPADGFLIASGITDKRSFLIPSENGIKWGELFPGIFQIRIVPGDSQSTILVNGIQYRGCVEIYNIEDTLNVVNEIDIENYIKSTLTYQFPESMNNEVMEAIAILARTNAYYMVSRNPNVFWHVDGNEIGYQGYALIFQNLHVDRAVENTHHMVLTYNKNPFATAWTQNSAGKTAEFAAIFRKESPAPSGVTAPLAEKDRDKHRWSFTLTKQQLAKIAKTNNVTEVKLFQEKGSGKVYGIRIVDRSDSHDIDFFNLQKAIGKNRLLSNDFTVTLAGDTISFTGFGEGHGVGLCIYSANLMARRGDNTSKILAAFYPNTQLENIRTFNSSTSSLADSDSSDSKEDKASLVGKDKE